MKAAHGTEVVCARRRDCRAVRCRHRVKHGWSWWCVMPPCNPEVTGWRVSCGPEGVLMTRDEAAG